MTARGLTGRIAQRLNGSRREIIVGLLGALVAGAGAYLILGRQVVTATDARAVRSELHQAIDRNTGAITDVTERLGAVEASQRTLERGQRHMETRLVGEQREVRRRIDAMMMHLSVPQPE